MAKSVDGGSGRVEREAKRELIFRLTLSPTSHPPLAPAHTTIANFTTNPILRWFFKTPRFVASFSKQTKRCLQQNKTQLVVVLVHTPHADLLTPDAVAVSDPLKGKEMAERAGLGERKTLQ